MRVKGTLLLDYVRMIRANKELDWDEYLETEDWEVINSQILSSQWYSYDSFRRIAYGVFKVIGKSENLSISRDYRFRELFSIEHMSPVDLTTRCYYNASKTAAEL